MTGSWPTGRPRVLVTDAWLANSGDGAIALAVDEMLRTLVPDAAVLHAAYQADVVGAEYPTLRLVPPLSTIVGVAGAAPLPPGWSRPTASGLLDDADLVVSQGGGFLLEHYQPWERLFALSNVVERGRPLVLLGQTIGAFRLARARALLRQILRGALGVAVRDEESRAHALELGASADDLELTTDLTMTLFPDGPTTPDPRTGVGVVLTTHEESRSSANGRQKLANTLLAEVMARTDGEPVIVASTVQGLGAAGFEDDASAAKTAVAALPLRQRSGVDIVDGYLGPAASIGLFGSCRAVVSQRLHPALFALGQGVPAALLLAADKAGALDGAALGSLVCRHPEDPIARAGALDAVLGMRAPGSPELREALAPVRARAQRNVDLLARTLKELGWGS